MVLSLFRQLAVKDERKIEKTIRYIMASGTKHHCNIRGDRPWIASKGPGGTIF